MNAEAKDFWERSLQAMETATQLISTDPDASASRSYYAAFYALSALFALDGKFFAKHSALEAAVHRDLVKSGRLPQEIGADYSFLRGLRDTGDYGGGAHVSEDAANQAAKATRRIVAAMQKINPETFSDTISG